VDTTLAAIGAVAAGVAASALLAAGRIAGPVNCVFDVSPPGLRPPPPPLAASRCRGVFDFPALFARPLPDDGGDGVAIVD
jgi:hypothetical protein